MFHDCARSLIGRTLRCSGRFSMRFKNGNQPPSKDAGRSLLLPGFARGGAKPFLRTKLSSLSVSTRVPASRRRQTCSMQRGEHRNGSGCAPGSGSIRCVTGAKRARLLAVQRLQALLASKPADCAARDGSFRVRRIEGLRETAEWPVCLCVARDRRAKPSRQADRPITRASNRCDRRRSGGGVMPIQYRRHSFSRQTRWCGRLRPCGPSPI